MKNKNRIAILANKSYGLYFGEILSFDPSTGVAEVKNCQHVCRWYGKTGGITSLAAFGICGPNKLNSRIGAPCGATLTNIINIFDCSKEAIKSFGEIVPK